MSLKQDRTSPRTPTDLERRYNFGKSFAELKGIATDAQTHTRKAEKTANELSQLLKDEETGLIAKLEMKLDTDKLISKFNMAANEVTIKSDNFTLKSDGTITARNGTFYGNVYAESGEIGDWYLTDGKLYAAKTDNGEMHQTVIEPNNIETHYEDDTQVRYAKLGDGGLEISLAGENIVMPTFATFRFNGKTYSLYVDFANGNTLKAYEWGE